ncbi:hypothetical protein CBL_07847 [Carabus blaptoides fortunei]
MENMRPVIKHPDEAPPIPPRAPVAANRASVDSLEGVQLRHPANNNNNSTYDVPQPHQNGSGQWRHTQTTMLPTSATVYNTEVLPPPLPDSAPPLDNQRMVAGPKWYHESFDSTSSDGTFASTTSRTDTYSRPVSMPAEYRSASVSSADSDHPTAQPKKSRMLSGIFSRKKKTTSQM